MTTSDPRVDSSDVGAVLVPVKAFDQAKGRLAAAVPSGDRALLAERMATHVVRSQHVPVAVSCDDEAVAEWARALGAEVVWCPGTGLNGAIDAGFRHLRDAGVTSVAIAHSDLPLASSLHTLLGWPGVTIVPDRHRTGTNVMALPTELDFEFSYGTGSFGRHVIEAVRHRRGLRIVHDAALGWDIDHPADLDLPDPDLMRRLLEERPEPEEITA